MHMLWVMLALLVLYILRAFMGPTVWDRLLAMNLISTKTIIIIVVLASALYGGTAFLLDFAIIYALSSFLGTIFIALFLSERRLGKRRVRPKRSKENIDNGEE